MGNIIEARGLSVSFGNTCAVNNLSFSVKAGEIVGILGPNGAGKSTSMRMLTGFLSPDTGSVHINNIDMATNPVAAKQQIGYLPEGAPSYSDMTVKQFLEFIAEVRGYRGYEAIEKISLSINQANLQTVLEQRIDTLSKGFKRRVGLAQALLHQPSILVLDEPTDGLDPNQKYEVRSLIKRLSQDKAVIISTHILEEVEAICNRVIVMANGKVISDSTPQALQAQSGRHNILTAKFVGVSVSEVSEVLNNNNIVVLSIDFINDEFPHVYIELSTDTNYGIIDKLNYILIKENWKLLELKKITGHLDEVFREMTTKQMQIS